MESLEDRRMLFGDILVKVSDDPNANGINEPTEDRLPGWTVFIDSNLNDTLDAGEPSLVTDGRGEAVFTGLTEGFYRVGEIVEPTYTPTSPVFVTARVRDDRQENVSFLNFHPLIGDIRGSIWNDLDGDGLRDTDLVTGAFTDPGSPDRTVFLDTNGDGLPTPGELTTLTDATGQYAFLGLSAGSYTVTEILPDGWETTSGSNIARTVNVQDNQTRIVDFGNFLTQAVTVQGTVWNDLNGNSIREIDPATGEFADPGLAGWQVFVDVDGDGAPTAGEPSAISDAIGAYTITGASHGTFTVREVVQADSTPTAPASGARALTLRNGQVHSGIDFGNHQRQESSIFGTVYVDANHNEARDAGELGLSGIAVFLDLNLNGVLDTGEPQTVTSNDLFFTPATDETGSYSRRQLPRSRNPACQSVVHARIATGSRRRAWCGGCPWRRRFWERLPSQ
jgi:hypothetical protein